MKKFIRRLKPFFKRYGRRSRARRLMKRGLYSTALTRPTNEWSRVSRWSNIPTSVCSRIKAAFTTTVLNIT